ncbi:hypothetical protein [Desulfogranum japonicum]|uniref:hypothetical protein n=1 Tax=Desulfogranum japonicum TaxID=231447 RepID=UPI00048BA445|nr:hypothetical protein [Desulfogranum japonicum]
MPANTLNIRGDASFPGKLGGHRQRQIELRALAMSIQSTVRVSLYRVHMKGRSNQNGYFAALAASINN